MASLPRSCFLLLLPPRRQGPSSSRLHPLSSSTPVLRHTISFTKFSIILNWGIRVLKVIRSHGTQNGCSTISALRDCSRSLHASHRVSACCFQLSCSQLYISYC